MGVYVVRTPSLNDKHRCQLFRKAPVLFFLLLSVSTANLSCLLATNFSSLRFLFNFTSLQSFESGQRGFLFSHFRSILSLSFLCSSISSFLSERFFFVTIKLLYSVVEINNTGVTGQSLPPQNDFEHARGLRNSAYAVNLTYKTYRHTYIHISREISIEHPSVGLASLAQLLLYMIIFRVRWCTVVVVLYPPPLSPFIILF